MQQQVVERTRQVWHEPRWKELHRMRPVCSACSGSCVLNAQGEVIFCDDCWERAQADSGIYEVGGGD
jgi:hypothetical protein